MVVSDGAILPPQWPAPWPRYTRRTNIHPYVRPGRFAAVAGWTGGAHSFTGRSRRSSIRSSETAGAGFGPDDVVGNRSTSRGVGDDGALQIVDRKKLLPTTHGGSWNGLNPDTEQRRDRAGATGPVYMSADQGGHTSMPVFGLTPASYAKFTESRRANRAARVRATANLCRSAALELRRGRHDREFEDRTAGNADRAKSCKGPMVLSTMWVDRAWARSILGQYCTAERATACIRARRTSQSVYGSCVSCVLHRRRARVESRARRVRSRWALCPVSNANTIQPDGYMTNNVRVDNRGFIYATDATVRARYSRAAREGRRASASARVRRRRRRRMS